jgi:peptidyl-tRNA hydrolase, PTH1 family
VKLIVGLGNPGREYRDTRHNAGFMVLDEIARRHGLVWAMAPAQVPEALVAKKFATLLGSGRDTTRLAKEAVLLTKPLTYMNVSGEAAAALLRYYDVDAADLLIVVDDIDIPFGRLRARASGSAGTHNGLRSIVDRLGTGFPRLRVGVGRGDARRDLADHVLAKFEPAEREQLESIIARAADAAEMFAAEGIVKVMNTYNADDAEPAE